jgi:hypothetical protein
MVRRQLVDGGTLTDMIEAWQQQEQYHYWPTRIKECFRFPSIRALADQRLQVMRRFMTDLQASCSMADAVRGGGPQAPGAS